MKKLLAMFLIAGSLAAALPCSAVFASPIETTRLAPPLRPLQTLLAAIDELNLTHDQRQQAKNILSSRQDDLINAASAVFSARLALFDAIHQDAYDEEGVKRAAGETAAAEEQLALVRAQLVSELRQILSDQQKALLAQKRSAVAERVKGIAEKVKSRFVSWLAAPAV